MDILDELFALNDLDVIESDIEHNATAVESNEYPSATSSDSHGTLLPRPANLVASTAIGASESNFLTINKLLDDILMDGLSSRDAKDTNSGVLPVDHCHHASLKIPQKQYTDKIVQKRLTLTLRYAAVKCDSHLPKLMRILRALTRIVTYLTRLPYSLNEVFELSHMQLLLFTP